MVDFEEKLNYIKNWLKTGSINIFGLPMSGKDTVGLRLSEAIGAKFLSSGYIIRVKEKEMDKNLTGDGSLVPTNVFYDLVLPFFGREELRDFPLILSSVGRWSGEENEVMSAAKNANHEIKAAVILQVSEYDVKNRWETVNLLGSDREAREDDKSEEVFARRIAEFREKTMPVVEHYRNMGLLVDVRADVSREKVFENLVNSLYDFAISKKN